MDGNCVNSVLTVKPVSAVAESPTVPVFYDSRLFGLYSYTEVTEVCKRIHWGGTKYGLSESINEPFCKIKRLGLGWIKSDYFWGGATDFFFLGGGGGASCRKPCKLRTADNLCMASSGDSWHDLSPERSSTYLFPFRATGPSVPVWCSKKSYVITNCRVYARHTLQFVMTWQSPTVAVTVVSWLRVVHTGDICWARFIFWLLIYYMYSRSSIHMSTNPLTQDFITIAFMMIKDHASNRR